MLAVISPAKSLDYESPLATDRATHPAFTDRSAILVERLAESTPDDLRQLMSISEPLAELNAERFRQWSPDVEAEAARPAVLAFSGDVYQGLEAGSFGTRDFTRAQKSLRILSGLYGVLRPLDLMQPYRLEMSTRLDGPWGEDLYDFWGDRITAALAADLEASPGAGVLVNLASAEYFTAVHPDAFGARVISPVFLDRKEDGEPKIISFCAKRARGAMAGWMVRERVSAIKDLSEFTGLGYAYDAERSEPDRPVFIRAASG